MNNIDLDKIEYSPVLNHNYSKWFVDVQYNGKTLSNAERRDCIARMDEAIEQYSKGIPIYKTALEEGKDKEDEFNVANRTVVSVLLFVLITTMDSIVASKYFILADKDYDRRFLRGKLMVILNEGFKRLYGFDEKTHKKSEWDRLLPLMKYFPEEINLQYRDLTFLLEKHARSSSWWREERNLETHLVVDKLIASRQEEIIESKVMMDSMKLFNTLQAVDSFLTNCHACLLNILITKLRRGELKE